MAERTASKCQRKWGSEFSWAIREMGNLERVPSFSGLCFPHPYKEGFRVTFWALKCDVTKRLFKIK